MELLNSNTNHNHITDPNLELASPDIVLNTAN